MISLRPYIPCERIYSSSYLTVHSKKVMARQGQMHIVHHGRDHWGEGQGGYGQVWGRCQESCSMGKLETCRHLI